MLNTKLNTAKYTLYLIILVSEKKGTFKLDGKANTGIIYVPADITKDSGFPLLPRNVKIRIEDNHLIIEPLPPSPRYSVILPAFQKLLKKKRYISPMPDATVQTTEPSRNSRKNSLRI